MYRLQAGLDSSAMWTTVLDTELADSRQLEDENPARVQEIPLTKETTAQFVKFELLTWYGNGGGLQYFDIIRK